VEGEQMLSAEWARIGPWGLVTIFVLLVAFGMLIPRWSHTQRVNDLKDQIAEWKAIAHQALGSGEAAVRTAVKVLDQSANEDEVAPR
jgi:hypothetical protein